MLSRKQTLCTKMWFKATRYVSIFCCHKFISLFVWVIMPYNSRNIPPLFCALLMQAVFFFELSKIVYTTIDSVRTHRDIVCGLYAFPPKPENLHDLSVFIYWHELQLISFYRNRKKFRWIFTMVTFLDYMSTYINLYLSK
jgi:hypothetical protein